MSLTPYAALEIALYGSDPQKQASAGGIAPDRRLGSHLLLAREMTKTANTLLADEKVKHLAAPLQKAAENVAKGYPAHSAVTAACGGDMKLAEQAKSLIGAMAMDLLQQRIEKTYEAKAAAFLAAKKAAA